MNQMINMSAVPLTMSSREIAELTGKQHSNVMRDIRAMMEAISMDSDLNPCAKSTTYIGKDGRQYDQYELDKDTCLTLLLGYDAVARMRVVKRWQELEARPAQFLIPQSLPEALRLAADESERADRAEAQLAIAAPKAEALDMISASDKAVTVTEAAKILGVKRDFLTNWLHANSWAYRLNGSWVAYQQHINNGRLQYKEAKYTDDNTGQEVHKPYFHILPKGLTKLAEAFASGRKAA